MDYIRNLLRLLLVLLIVFVEQFSFAPRQSYYTRGPTT